MSKDVQNANSKFNLQNSINSIFELIESVEEKEKQFNALKIELIELNNSIKTKQIELLNVEEIKNLINLSKSSQREFYKLILSNKEYNKLSDTQIAFLLKLDKIEIRSNLAKNTSVTSGGSNNSSKIIELTDTHGRVTFHNSPSACIQNISYAAGLSNYMSIHNVSIDEAKKHVKIKSIAAGDKIDLSKSSSGTFRYLNFDWKWRLIDKLPEGEILITNQKQIV